MLPLLFSPSKKLIWIAATALVLLVGFIYFLTLPVAEIALVRRGTAISAVYGTVRIEPTLLAPRPAARVSPN